MPSGSTSFSRAATPYGQPSSRRPSGIWKCRRRAPSPASPTRPLFPLVFCRQCGTAYYRVKARRPASGRTLMPREDRREESDDGSGDAYLYVSEPRPGREQRVQDCSSACLSIHKGNNAARRGARSRQIREAIFPNPSSSMRRQVVSEGQGIPAALDPATISCSASNPRAGWPTPRANALNAPSWRPSAWTTAAQRRRSWRSGLSSSCRATAISTRGPQAPELHRQPAGRLASGRPFQRLRPGGVAALSTSQGDEGERVARAEPRRAFAQRFRCDATPI